MSTPIIGTLESWRAPDRRPTGREWVATISVVSAWMVAFVLGGRNLWFYSDIWPTLGNPGFEINELLRPHGGYWILPAALSTNIVYAIAGMDFYPMYLLPMALAIGLLGVTSWRALRLIGVSNAVGVATSLVIISLPSTAFHTSTQYVGNLLFLTAVVLVASVLSSPSSTAQARIVLFGALVVGFMSEGSAVVLWTAAVLVVAAQRRFHHFWWPLVGSMLVFGTWYAVYGREAGGATSPILPTPDKWGAALQPAGRLLNAAISDALGIPAWLVWGLLLFGFPFVARRLVRCRQLHPFSSVAALTLIGTVAAVSLIRVVAQGFPGEAPAYLYNVGVLLVLSAGPALASVRTPAVPWITVALLVVAGFGMVGLYDSFRERSEVHALARQRVEAAAWIISQDEAYIPFVAVSHQAVARNLAALVEDGWAVSEPSDQELLAEIRTDLRVTVLYEQPEPRGRPIQTVGEGVLCREARNGLTADVVGGGFILLELSRGEDVDVLWVDDNGPVSSSFSIAGEDPALVLAPPRSPTTVSVRDESPLRYCVLGD